MILRLFLVIAMYSQGSSSQIKSISQPLPLLTVWKGSIGICSRQQLTIYYLNYLSVTFETNIILLYSTCQNYCSWYCNLFDNKIGSKCALSFPKEREGQKICNFSLQLFQGKQVGKSHSQIWPQKVQKVHMLYFEKKVQTVNSFLDYIWIFF